MEHDEDLFDEAYQAANIPDGVEHNGPIADGNAGHPSVLFAAYLLRLETHNRLSIKAIDSSVQNTVDLIKNFSEMKLSWVQKQIRDAGSDIMLHQNDTYVCALSQVASLKSNHLRTAFYKEHCGMVPPREIVLGHRMLYVKGRMRQRRDLAYCVPVKDLLLALVSMPEVRHHINNPHCTRDGYMGDFCDGTSYESHPLLRHNKKALQFL